MPENIMDQVNEYKQQGTNDRFSNVEKRMDEFVRQTAIDKDITRDDTHKAIDEKINEIFTASLANTTNGITDSRIDLLERQVRLNELVNSVNGADI